jgi:hypothetical protein
MSTVIVLLAIAALAYAALVALAVEVVVASAEGDPVADVQRSIELTQAAHGAIPPGPALSDPGGATSAAVGRFLDRKEDARQALWASRGARTQEAADEVRTDMNRQTEGRTPCVFSSPEQAARSAAGSFPS